MHVFLMTLDSISEGYSVCAEGTKRAGLLSESCVFWNYFSSQHRASLSDIYKAPVTMGTKLNNRKAKGKKKKRKKKVFSTLLYAFREKWDWVEHQLQTSVLVWIQPKDFQQKYQWQHRLPSSLSLKSIPPPEKWKSIFEKAMTCPGLQSVILIKMG